MNSTSHNEQLTKMIKSMKSIVILWPQLKVGKEVLIGGDTDGNR